MNLKSYESEILQGIRKLNYRDLLIFAIPIIVFSVYLSVFNPGILTIESFNQLHQIASNHFLNNYPIFHTFIEMICLNISGSPMSIGILQILVFTSMWTAICKYLRDDSNDNSDVFVLQAIITLIICFIPINAIYSITLWKEVLFSYFLMFLCFLIKVMLDKKGKVNYEFIIVLAITMAFVSQLRSNGIYIVLVLLIILAIYLFKKDKSQKMYIALPALAIVVILLIASLNLAYNVEDVQKDDVFSKTSHMLADYDLNLDLKDSDKDKIHELIDENAINKYYSIYYSDPISGNANEQVFNNDSGAYIGLAASYSLQNPMHFLYYMFKSADIVWDITRDADWAGAPYYITDDGPNIEGAKEKYFTSINSNPNESYENISNTNQNTGKYGLFSSIMNAIRTNIVLDTLFDSPALYMYLSIILLVIMHVITKSKELYLVYLPNFLNILIVFVSIPVQDNRYLYPNLLVFYLLLIIAVSLIMSSKDKLLVSTENTGSLKTKPVNYAENYFKDEEPLIDLNNNINGIYQDSPQHSSEVDNYNIDEIDLDEVIYSLDETSKEDISSQREEAPKQVETEIKAKTLKEPEKQDKK